MKSRVLELRSGFREQLGCVTFVRDAMKLQRSVLSLVGDDVDPGLLERGLAQIRSTVGALLFDARLDSPAMNLPDWQDLKLLIAPQILAKQAAFRWDIDWTRR
jgi:hypothetical protein